MGCRDRQPQLGINLGAQVGFSLTYPYLALWEALFTSQNKHGLIELGQAAHFSLHSLFVLRD